MKKNKTTEKRAAYGPATDVMRAASPRGSLCGPRFAKAVPVRRAARGAAALVPRPSRPPASSGTVVTPPAGPLGAAAPQGTPGGNIATSEQADQYIRQSLQGKLDTFNVIRLGDAKFYVPTLAELRAIIASSQAHRQQYTDERFDCDDFSYVLKGEFSLHFYKAVNLVCGLAAGIIWGRFAWVQEFHSANFGLTSDHGFVLIEPQSGNQPDKLYPLTECQGGVSLILM